MITITGTTINHESRQVHVYYYEEISLSGGRIHKNETSAVFDEDLEFDNQENWGNNYIEEHLANKLGVPRNEVVTIIRKYPPEPVDTKPTE